MESNVHKEAGREKGAEEEEKCYEVMYFVCEKHKIFGLESTATFTTTNTFLYVLNKQFPTQTDHALYIYF